MNKRIVMVLIAYFLIPFPLKAEEVHQDSKAAFSNHLEWLQCVSSEQCIVIKSKNCQIRYAVNEKYAEQANKIAPDDCNKIRSGGPSVPKCWNGYCVLTNG